MLSLLAPSAVAVTTSAQYMSPLNKDRPQRKTTQYIILHTTEGGAAGALKKMRDNGECHYLVSTNGVIYRIIDRNKFAPHAGLSLWDGRYDISTVSVGIEVVGYHDKPPTAAQVKSLRDLLKELKKLYAIPDTRVLTHSMVAYGEPNKWHPKKHRGRKRCGMVFADSGLRLRLGIAAKPAYDHDLRAGRLTNADPELTRILYKK